MGLPERNCASASAAPPKYPVTQSPSPSRAPERRTGRSTSPMTHTSTMYRSERVKSPPSTLASRLCATVATPAMMSAAASVPFLPSGGTPSDTSTPSGVAPSAARSDMAEPAARTPISLKASQSVRKCTFSRELSMLIASVVDPKGISAQSSPRSGTSPVISAIRAMMPRTRSNSLPGPRFIGMPCITTRRGFKFREHRRSGRLDVFPRSPHVRKRGEHVGRAQAPRGPLPGSLLRSSTQGMRAERGGLGGRRPPRQKRTDESGEEITAAAGREAGVAARDDVLGTAEIGDDGRNTFQQNGALELRRGARRRRPAIVRRFVRQCVSGERAELAEMRRQNQVSSAWCQVCIRKDIECVRINNRRHGTSRQNARDQAPSRSARLTTEARAEDYGIRPFERLSGCRFELFTERGLHRQHVGETGLRRRDRLDRRDQ